MRWHKLGFIFKAAQQTAWMHDYAMLPTAQALGGDIFRIFFSPRDAENRGHIAYLEINLNEPQKILYLADKPCMTPGKRGAFDDNGVVLSSLVSVADKTRGYFVGLDVGASIRFNAAIGISDWSEKEKVFTRRFLGPIVDRDRHHPYFSTAPSVLYIEGKFKMWCTTCHGWELEDKAWKHYYNIEYLESTDGENWQRNDITAIPFAAKTEYAVARPCVLKDKDRYKMWFCSRALYGVETYRIRYAESADGINWTRKDHEAGIEVSAAGWDSEMICYPYVFDHAGKRYMLYNGNGYGKSGFGLAVLEQD